MLGISHYHAMKLQKKAPMGTYGTIGAGIFRLERTFGECLFNQREHLCGGEATGIESVQIDAGAQFAGVELYRMGPGRGSWHADGRYNAAGHVVHFDGGVCSEWQAEVDRGGWIKGIRIIL